MAWRKPTNLNEWAGVLARHKKKAIFPALGVMITVVIASFAMEREYRAEAKFSRVSDVAIDAAGSSVLKGSLMPVRKSLNEDLIGRPALEQLIEDLGMTRGLPHTADGALTFQGQLKKNDMIEKLKTRLSRPQFVTQSDQIDQIAISFSDPDREMAPKVVNTLVENYLRETRRRLDETLLRGQAFFEKEVDRYKALVQDLEAKEVQFKMNNAGLLPDDPASVQSKLIELRSRQQNVTQELEVSKAQRAKQEEWIKAQPDEIVKKQTIQNPVIAQLIAQRGELDKQLKEHLFGLGRTDEHPLVKKTRQQIAEVEKQIAATQQLVDGTATSEPNAAKINAQQQVQTLIGTINALTRQRDELTDQIDKFEMLDRNFVVVRAEYVKLQRDLQEASDQLKFWEGNLNRTTIALKAELGARGVRLNFTQHADVARPSRPTFFGVLGVAVMLGLATGGLILLLAEVTDHSFRDADQAAEELNLPVLGSVTEILTPAEVVRRKVFSWAVFPAVGAVMVLVLTISCWLMFLSLEDSQRFSLLLRHPARVLSEGITGRGG